MITRCVFCGYVGTERTFREVPTEEHPYDMICELCDTNVSTEAGTEDTTTARPVQEMPRRERLPRHRP